MIDYEKLQLAHELAHKYALQSDDVINITVHFMGKDIVYFLDGSAIYESDYGSIDEVIAKLTELTKPEHKYKIGENIWAISDPENVPLMLKVSNCFISNIHHKRCYEFANSFKARFEDDCYPSRESLIESQIKHWQSL